MNISIILLAVTIMPLSSIFMFSYLNTGGNIFGVFFSLSMLAAVIHVPLTIMVMSDALTLKFLRSNPVKAVVVPIFIIVIFVYTVSSRLDEYLSILMLIYIVWQSFHYGRQNIGILSVIKRHQGAGTVTKLDRITLNLAALSAAVGAPLLWSDGGLMLGNDWLSVSDASNHYYKVAYGLAVVSCLIAALFGLVRGILVYRNNFIVFLMYIVGSCFFLPMLFPSNGLYVNFWPYAITHGLQYCVMVLLYQFGSTTFSRNEMQIKLLSLFIFLFVAIVYVSGAEKFTNLIDSIAEFDGYIYGVEFKKLIVGLVFGITAAHFWIDQYIWRFSINERREWFLKYYGRYFN